MVSARFRRTLTKPAVLIALGLLVVVGVIGTWRLLAANERIYFAQTNINATPGSSFSVDVNVDSPDVAIISSRLKVNFPSDKIDFVTASSGSGAFPFKSVPDDVTPGTVFVARSIDFTTGGTPQKGTGLAFTTLTFKVKDGVSGAVNLSFDTSSTFINDTTGAKVAVATNTATVTLPTLLTPPGVPTNLQSFNITQNSLSLNWTAPVDGGPAANYIISRNGVDIGTVAATSFADSGLSPATTYSYQVRAHNDAGDSAKSPPVSVTTLPPATSPPGKPVGVSAAAVTAFGLTINWSAPVDGGSVANYIVSATGGSGAPAQTVGASVFSASFTGLSPDTAYIFTVTARNSAGSAADSVAVRTLPTTSSPQANLYLSPDSAVVTAGSEVDFVLKVDDAVEGIVGAAANIRFDATKFDVLDVSQGSGPFPFSPTGSNYEITGTGADSALQIYRTIVIGNPAVKGSGLEVATIKLRAKDGVDATTDLVFNAALSRVNREGDGSNTLKSTTGTAVTIYTVPTNPGGGTPPPEPPPPATIFDYPTFSSTTGPEVTTPPGSSSTGPTTTNSSESVVDLGATANGTTLILSLVDKNGKPVAGAKVQLAGKTVTSDRHGTVTFTHILPGTYKIKVNGHTASPSEITISANADLTAPQRFTVTTATVTGPLHLPRPVLAVIVGLVLLIVIIILVRMGWTRLGSKSRLASAPAGGSTTTKHNQTTPATPKKSSTEPFDATSVNTKVFYPQDPDNKK